MLNLIHRRVRNISTDIENIFAEVAVSMSELDCLYFLFELEVSRIFK
jgi:hypothetical protein